MEDLDSRTSLFQPGENGVNGQALVQAAQALVQSHFESDVFGDFYKAHLILVLDVFVDLF